MYKGDCTYKSNRSSVRADSTGFKYCSLSPKETCNQRITNQERIKWLLHLEESLRDS